MSFNLSLYVVLEIVKKIFLNFKNIEKDCSRLISIENVF